MRTHFIFALLALVLTSCASHQSQGLTGQKLQESRDYHASMIGNQADRFR